MIEELMDKVFKFSTYDYKVVKSEIKQETNAEGQIELVPINTTTTYTLPSFNSVLLAILTLMFFSKTLKFIYSFFDTKFFINLFGGRKNGSV